MFKLMSVTEANVSSSAAQCLKQHNLVVRGQGLLQIKDLHTVDEAAHVPADMSLLINDAKADAGVSGVEIIEQRIERGCLTSAPMAQKVG